jgi:hypothetical protein
MTLPPYHQYSEHDAPIPTQDSLLQAHPTDMVSVCSYLFNSSVYRAQSLQYTVKNVQDIFDINSPLQIDNSTPTVNMAASVFFARKWRITCVAPGQGKYPPEGTYACLYQWYTVYPDIPVDATERDERNVHVHIRLICHVYLLSDICERHCVRKLSKLILIVLSLLFVLLFELCVLLRDVINALPHHLELAKQVFFTRLLPSCVSLHHVYGQPSDHRTYLTPHRRPVWDGT